MHIAKVVSIIARQVTFTSQSGYVFTSQLIVLKLVGFTTSSSSGRDVNLPNELSGYIVLRENPFKTIHGFEMKLQNLSKLT